MKSSFKYIFILLFIQISCSKSFLDEVPLSFLIKNNGYINYTDFTLAVNDLHSKVRSEFYSNDEDSPFHYITGLDFVYDGEPGNAQRFSPMATAHDPTNEITRIHWNKLYQIVAGANTIIDLSDASEMTDEQKREVVANAKFFRAFAYRTLAYLFGGVPLNSTIVSGPKNDYVLSTRPLVYAQCIKDLNEAIPNLKNINEVLDGKINKQAAQHLLAEVYLANKQYQEAVETSSLVISNSQVRMMTERFGSKANQADGDPYWDLFQPGNQNRTSGNREGLWVIQFETDLPGGGSSSSSRAGYALERQCAPFIAQMTNAVLPVNPFITPADDHTGGRGIGWSIPTAHFSQTIWQSDFTTDKRNSNLNFVREYRSTNPNSPYFGQIISTENPPPGITVPSRSFFAYQGKITTPGAHPKNLFAPGSDLQMTSVAGITYLDQYMFRLAETYLIRAEAKMYLGDLNAAAQDINVIRQRSNASAVNSSQVNIDYILDERLREFGVEEKRRLTLMRLGLLYDRVSRFNPFFNDQVLPKYNLWPIPQAERDANPGLGQNEGYN